MTLRSGPKQVSLIELFTSEGCSSCPPAEKWMASLASAEGLWREFVPVVFHVDYWDHLGWADRFASKANTDRQRRYAAAWGAESVYTPGLVLNGKEWRRWGRLPEVTQSARPEAGLLEVHSSRSGFISVTYEPTSLGGEEAVATAAWLSGEMLSDVSSGENAGRRLRHGFVVLSLGTVALKASGKTRAGSMKLPVPDLRKPGRLAMAVWVSGRGSPAPWQAAGGWWPEGDFAK